MQSTMELEGWCGDSIVSQHRMYENNRSRWRMWKVLNWIYKWRRRLEIAIRKNNKEVAPTFSDVQHGLAALNNTSVNSVLTSSSTLVW